MTTAEYTEYARILEMKLHFIALKPQVLLPPFLQRQLLSRLFVLLSGLLVIFSKNSNSH